MDYDRRHRAVNRYLRLPLRSQGHLLGSLPSILTELLCSLSFSDAPFDLDSCHIPRILMILSRSDFRYCLRGLNSPLHDTLKLQLICVMTCPIIFNKTCICNGADIAPGPTVCIAMAGRELISLP